jgi:cytochrome c biogenesis factor
MQAQQRISGLNLLTYRAMQFGIVLVAAGTILGGVWADYSWGRFWGWDPKEVWALVVTLTYVAIVHGRMTNWIPPFAFAVTSVAGFLSVLMAWYGVNFILGVGLHSYGFASGGTGYVVGFSALQLLYVGAIALYHRNATSKSVSMTPQNV